MALTQLSALDASFVRLDEPRVHMHVTWIAFFGAANERPRPTVEALRTSIDARLALMPRFRQRLASPPAGMGDPFWVDDPDFDVARPTSRATRRAFQADPDVLGDVDALPRALDAELDALAGAFAPSRVPASRSAPVA